MKISVSKKSLHSLYIRGSGFATHILRFFRGNAANAIMIQWHDLIIARTAGLKWTVITMADKEVRLIDKDKLIEKINAEIDAWGKARMCMTADELLETIEEFEEEAQPVKHGRWEICCDGYYPYCSNCKNEPQGREMTAYCPNCGAKMDIIYQDDKIKAVKVVGWEGDNNG